MFNVIEAMAVYLVMALLKLVIKNPGAVKTEHTVISDIATVATQADTAVNGTVWSSTPGTPAPVTQ